LSGPVFRAQALAKVCRMGEAALRDGAKIEIPDGGR
jgi:hypothetical protein